jgi:hypothetical protein
MNRATRTLLLAAILTSLALLSCVGSVSMTVPIGGPYRGPYGGVTIGSGPIFW